MSGECEKMEIRQVEEIVKDWKSVNLNGYKIYYKVDNFIMIKVFNNEFYGIGIILYMTRIKLINIHNNNIFEFKYRDIVSIE